MEWQFRRKNGSPVPGTVERMMLPDGISWPIKLSAAQSPATTGIDREDLTVALHVERLDDATRRVLINDALTSIYDD